MAQTLFGALGPLPEFSGILSRISLLAILTFGLGAMATLAIYAYPRLRYRFHRLRLDRRLARDRLILRDDLAEYERAMGDEPEQLSLDRLVLSMLGAGLAVAVPTLMKDLALEGWYHFGVAALLVAGMIAWLWRRINDPAETHEPLLPEVAVPQEAVLGALAAIGIVLFMLAIVAWVF